jgi:preprotein translocase subunit SecD
MPRSFYMRLSVLLGLCGLSVYLLYPSYFFYFRATDAQRETNSTFCAALPSWAHCAKLNLGLDLQGGVHLVMGVRVDKALQHRADRLADSLRDSLEKKGLGGIRVQRPAANALILVQEVDQPTGQAAKVEALLRQEFPLLDVQHQPGGLSLSLSTMEAAAVRDGAVEQSIKTIRNRADKLGVTEPTIARRGNDQILIQLPGIKDPQHAIDVIGRTAQLEFTMLDPAGARRLRSLPTEDQPPQVIRRIDRASRSIYFELPEAQQAAVLEWVGSHLSADSVLAFGTATTELGQDRPGFLRTYVLQARPGITGDYLVQAQVQQDPQNAANYDVTMTFNGEGAKIFKKLTAAHVGEPMAIVLDGKVSSAPRISEAIGGGTARITLGRGGDSRKKFQEAKDLALVLKAGALPAPVEVLEKRQVGKTLGQDTVARGTFAMALGTGLVVLFMAFYYKLSGMMANLALVLNVLFMMAMLAMLEATLTLPGMAGIVLTIGMAVDANVLIFERIREELRAGKLPRVAIDAGYKKAFNTIFDSNITTVIAGVVLMQYGSGPVRGFAVTLIIGLMCSLYTAIVVTRLIYDAMTHNRPLTSLSI